MERPRFTALRQSRYDVRADEARRAAAEAKLGEAKVNTYAYVWHVPEAQADFGLWDELKCAHTFRDGAYRVTLARSYTAYRAVDGVPLLVGMCLVVLAVAWGVYFLK